MNLTWSLIRGSGFVAYGLLAASMLWGLMISSEDVWPRGQGEGSPVAPRIDRPCGPPCNRGAHRGALDG